jgi:outer membrane protein
MRLGKILLIAGLFCGIKSAHADPLTLDQIITQALSSNYTVRTATESLNKANADEDRALGGLFPSAVVGAEYQRIDKNRLNSFNGQTFGEDRSWKSEVELRQPIFTGGKLLSSYRRESILREAAELNLAAVKNKVKFDARTKYFDLLLARRTVAVESDLVTLREQLLKLEEQRHDVGMVPNFDVLRARVELANRKTPQIKAKNDERIANEELRRILGLETNDTKASLEVGGELNYEPLIVAEDMLVESARKTRPEMKRYQLLIEASSKNVWIQRADFFPQVSAYGGYGIEQSQFDLHDENKGWVVGARAEWTIFDSFQTSKAVEGAKSDLEAAKIALSEFQEGLSIDVRRAYSHLRESLELVDASRAVVEQAKEGLRLSEERLQVGSGIQLDVLEQQTSLTEAKTNEATALHDFQTARAELQYVTGADELPKP